MPDNRPLIGSEEWNALVQGTSVGFRSLAAEKLESADLSQLIGQLDPVPIKEQAVAINLLLASRHEEIPISDPEKEVLIAKLRPIMPIRAPRPDRPSPFPGQFSDFRPVVLKSQLHMRDAGR